MPGEQSPAPVAARLGPEALESCLELDRLALGGFWSRAQWQGELEQERRPCLGIWQGETLVALACGWLVVDELLGMQQAVIKSLEQNYDRVVGVAAATILGGMLSPLAGRGGGWRVRGCAGAGLGVPGLSVDGR